MPLIQALPPILQSQPLKRPTAQDAAHEAEEFAAVFIGFGLPFGVPLDGEDGPATGGAGKGFNDAVRCAGFHTQVRPQLVHALIMDRINFDAGLAKGGKNGPAFFKPDIMFMGEHRLKAYPIGGVVLEGTNWIGHIAP